jgi:glyoxylase-like metal-dependent hydrolase (beta-lactamase superfamily II)
LTTPLTETRPTDAAPDVSLANTAATGGLSYPLGERAPAMGEIIPVGADVGWIRLPLPGALGHINCWIVGDDGDALTIVDTGMRLPGCREAWDALFAAPLADRTIERILATHMHPDHVGLAGWLTERTGAMLWMTRGEFQGIRIATTDKREVPPPEVPAMQRGAGWTERQIDAASARGWARIGQIIHHLPFAYRRIVDGEDIRMGGADWRVVVGSGHSPEHACLLNDAEGLLIAGDQVLPTISSNVSLSAAEPYANPLGEWLASIDKLLTLDANLLVLPAHGRPFRGLHARLHALRDDHHERLDAMAAALTESPRRAVDCFPLLFRREIGDEHRGLATGETLAHLRWLEVEGRVRRESRDGVWWWGAV